MRRGGGLLTTGSRYYRLCGALQDPDIVGSRSGPVAQLPRELREEVVRRVVRLPSSIGLVSLRELAWSAAGLGRRHGLNLLAWEALAAAVTSTAAIATAEEHLPPRLATAARSERVRVYAAGARS